MTPLHYLNAIRDTGSYSEQQKTSRVFLFLVQTNLAGEFCCCIVFYPSLPKSPIKKYAADNQHDPIVPHPDLFWAYRFLEVKNWIV